MNDIHIATATSPLAPSTVVTLVHGTFARNAAWTMPNSSIPTHLRLHLGPSLVIEPFEWSGQNSHRARVLASADLVAHLQSLFERYPEALHSIVAHSHGGNVACYALRDPSVRGRLSSLVTIGTPFITCTPRRTPESIEALKFISSDLLGMVVACVAAAIGLLAAAWLAPLTSRENPTAAAIAIWATALLLPLVVLIKLARRLPRSVNTWYQALLHGQTSAQALLSLPRLENVRILSIAVRGDEADRYLQLLVRLANVPAWLFRSVDREVKQFFDGAFTSEYALDRLISYALFVLMPGLVAAIFVIGFALGAFEGADLARVALNFNIGLVLLVPFFLLVIAAVAQFFMVFLPRVVRAHRLGFGGESLVDNWLANIQVWSEPARAFAADAANCTFVRLRREQLGQVRRGSLAHSGLCESAVVASTIGRWLAGAPLDHSTDPIRSRWASRLGNALARVPPEDAAVRGARTVITRLLVANSIAFLIVRPLFETAADSGADFPWLFGLNPDDGLWWYYLTAFGNLSLDGVLSGPEWQLGPLTHMWWHDNGWRFLVDMWIVFAFGCGIEQRLRGAELFACCAYAGIGAGVVLVVTHPFLPLPLAHDGPTTGASGVALGVMAGCAILSPHHRVFRGVPVGASIMAPTLASMYLVCVWWPDGGHRLLLGASGFAVGAGYAVFRKWWTRPKGLLPSQPPPASTT